MRRGLVYFYPATNLGDDLFLKVLSERYPQITFEIAVDKGYGDLGIKNVVVSKYAKISGKMEMVLNRKGNNKILTIKKIIANHILNFCEKAMLRKKYLVKILITGSLFQQGGEVPGDYKPLNQYNENSPNFLIGANFGPFFQDEFLTSHKEKFENDFVAVSFRDKHSYNYFSDLPNAIYAPDVVLSGNLGAYKTESTDNVIISVMDFSIKPRLACYAEVYEKKICEIANMLIEKGKKVVFLSFCDQQGDRRAAERIVKNLKLDYNKDAEIVSYNKNIDSVLRLIAGSCFVIATRFHSMILSFYYQKRFFSFVYGEKTLHCLEDFNYTGNYCMIEDTDKLMLDDIIENYNKDIDVDISEKKEQSSNHFKYLDEYLSPYMK